MKSTSLKTGYLSKTAPLLCIILFLFAGCATTIKVPPGTETFYVSAAGSDRNNGLSEAAAFRSLFKALVMAARTQVKTVTVLGTLDAVSEQSSNPERVFIIQGTGAEQITIRGNSSSAALTTGGGLERRIVLVKGNCNINFENIEIYGGNAAGEGAGIGIGPGATVTLGPGSVIRDNRSGMVGGGIAVAPGGVLNLRGGAVRNNQALGVGGGIAAVGARSVLSFYDGEVSGNAAEGGGGIAVYEGCVFTLYRGTIAGNRAAVAGGGVVVNLNGTFTMEGGEVLDNVSSGSGGALALMSDSSFTMLNGSFRGNQSSEYGGGIASDASSVIALKGGVLAANSARSRGGAVYTAGALTKASGAVIYGRGSGGDANRAEQGQAVYVYRSGLDRFLDESAGTGVVLDSEQDGPGGGWNFASTGPVMGPSLPETGFDDSGTEQ